MKLDPGIHIVMHSVLFLKPGVTKNYRLRMVGSILEKFEGFSKKFWIKTEILLNSGGLRVYLPKTEGLLCKTPRVDRYITV